MSIIIHRAIIVTSDPVGSVLTNGSIEIKDDYIASVTSDLTLDHAGASEVIDARGSVIIPGFIQTHVHLCQTLFRGLADDLELLEWLQKRIFPFEAAHNDRSMYCSAMLGAAEMIRSGTTTVLDMGSVNHEEEIVRAVCESGLRAFVGKAMMDVNDAYPRLKESTVDAMKSTRALAERWHNSCKGRIRYAAAPRFVLSCSDRLLNETRELMESFDGMLLHTHASENMLEVQAVRERCKMENIEFLHRLGLLSSKTCLAHCVHLTEAEIGMLQQTRTNVTHCPSSNLKLGSGIAKIPYLMSKGINVSLGADGAPCNNTLNMFQEMRLASLIQKPVHGPTAMPAQTMFTMATIGGARTLGMEREIGSIEAGKKADLVVLDLNDVWNPVGEDNIYSSIVYSASPENVDSVMIDGKWIYRKKVFIGLNEEDIVQTSKKELKQLLERAELN